MTQGKCQECKYVTDLLEHKDICNDCYGVNWCGQGACHMCGAPAPFNVEHKHRKDGFVVPLGNGTSLVIRGRWFDSKTDDRNTPCFDLDALVWGYRIDATNLPAIESHGFTGIVAEGSSVYLRPTASFIDVRKPRR